MRVSYLFSLLVVIANKDIYIITCMYLFLLCFEVAVKVHLQYGAYLHRNKLILE